MVDSYPLQCETLPERCKSYYNQVHVEGGTTDFPGYVSTIYVTSMFFFQLANSFPEQNLCVPPFTFMSFGIHK